MMMRSRTVTAVVSVATCLCCLPVGFFVGRFYEAHRQALRPCAGEGAGAPIILTTPTSPLPPEIDHVVRPDVRVAAAVAVLEQRLRRAETMQQATETQCTVDRYNAVLEERVRLTGMTNPPGMEGR